MEEFKEQQEVKIGNFFSEDYLKKFKVFKSASLFEPTAWDITYWLKQMRCPICQRKLYWNLNKTKAFCKSKFKDKYFIDGKLLTQYLK